MPTYLNCPHCEHPQIVPGRRVGKTTFCRQCGWAYHASPITGIVRALPISTMGELRNRLAVHAQPELELVGA